MSGQEPYEIQEPDRSLGELVGRLSTEFGELVGTHMELAKVEIKEEVRKAGKGAGMMGGGAAAGYLAALLLSFAAAWGLAEVIPEGFAFLIVGVMWAVIAAALATQGRRELHEVHPAPQQTMQELQEDRRWVRQQAS